MRKTWLIVFIVVLVLALLGVLAVHRMNASVDEANRELLAAVREDAKNPPESQREALADGKVTKGEFMQAVRNEMRCVTEAGYKTSDPSWGEDGRYSFTSDADYSEAADPEAADAEFLRITDECQKEHAQIVATIWTLQHLDSGVGG